MHSIHGIIKPSSHVPTYIEHRVYIMYVAYCLVILLTWLIYVCSLNGHWLAAKATDLALNSSSLVFLNSRYPILGTSISVDLASGVQVDLNSYSNCWNFLIKYPYIVYAYPLVHPLIIYWRIFFGSRWYLFEVSTFLQYPWPEISSLQSNFGFGLYFWHLPCSSLVQKCF